MTEGQENPKSESPVNTKLEGKIPREWKIEPEKLEDLTPQLSMWLLFEVKDLVEFSKFP